MGTRSFVGVYDDQGDWVARYCHWDGYPSGVGASLWENYQKHFKANLGAMVEILVSEKIGWSSLGGCDLTLPPVWIDYPQKLICTEEVRSRLDQLQSNLKLPDSEFLSYLEDNAPKSYTARGETEEQLLTSKSDLGGLEWGYIFNLKDHRMDVYDNRSENGPKLVASVYLDLNADVEPNWAEMMGQGE